MNLFVNEQSELLGFILIINKVWFEVKKVRFLNAFLSNS
ncbi:hypothetical protein P20480_3720 [Pseudoalteromonas sp. BSi20480]|nr:hypothetical protein P20480_3720 [Pseudoalteromonas sp. BSi20480]